MNRFFISILMLFCALYVGAQNNIVDELQRDTVGQGVVRIHHPLKLNELMGSMIERNGKPAQIEGYRVMVYSGNNSRQARDEANNMAQYMRETFPGAEVYVVFESPIRSCQYGDYRTREEAEAVMYRLKATRRFREISVTKTMINLPY